VGCLKDFLFVMGLIKVWKTSNYFFLKFDYKIYTVCQKILLQMNNKPNVKEKDFDTVRFFREVKEKIAKETKGMSFAEFKENLNQRKLKLVK
jgi:hypothetical protein